MNVQRTKVMVIILAAVAAVAVAAAGYFAWSTIRAPAPQTIEEIVEPPLPDDPTQAEIIVEQRYVGDKIDGLDKETRERRQEARLKQLEEIKRKAAQSRRE